MHKIQWCVLSCHASWENILIPFINDDARCKINQHETSKLTIILYIYLDYIETSIYFVSNEKVSCMLIISRVSHFVFDWYLIYLRRNYDSCYKVTSSLIDWAHAQKLTPVGHQTDHHGVN